MSILQCTYKCVNACVHFSTSTPSDVLVSSRQQQVSWRRRRSSDTRPGCSDANTTVFICKRPKATLANKQTSVLSVSVSHVYTFTANNDTCLTC